MKVAKQILEQRFRLGAKAGGASGRLALRAEPRSAQWRRLPPGAPVLHPAQAALAEVRGKITASRVEQVDGQPVYVFGIAAPQQPVVWVRVSGVTGKVL